MNPQHRIMVVDDEPSMLRYLTTLLEVDGFDVVPVNSGVEAVNRVNRGERPDLVLLDLLMPQMDGLETIEKLRTTVPGMNIVMLSCVADTAKVVQAMRLGAQDYLTKPFQKQELDNVLRRTLPEIGKDEPTVSTIEELGDGTFFLAASAAMNKIRSQVGLVANVQVPVLLLGESGTGKEVVARLIHKLSPRANRTFLKVNCAALPADLLESELFGYEAGAFTGADRAKPGKFEQCDKGTLLLDELGEMPPQLQAKLLHVLQDGQFSRLGSRSTIRVDVRVLAATNIDVKKAIANKTLREDLYYRLNAFTIQVPPLRERQDEIPFLLKQYMTRMAGSYARDPLPITPKLIEACHRAPWPGNLRELGNFVKRYIILGDEDLAIAELQRTQPQPPEAAKPADLKALVRGLKDEAEMEAIREALTRTNWKRKEAAEVLNISYKALLYKIRQYNIKPPNRSRQVGMGSRVQ